MPGKVSLSRMAIVRDNNYHLNCLLAVVEHLHMTDDPCKVMLISSPSAWELGSPKQGINFLPN